MAMRMLLNRRLLGGLGISIVLMAAAAGSPAASQVQPALQEARRHMLDADINTLMFHSMDTLFDTRTVGRSGPVWAIPRSDHALDFTYRFEGAEHSTDEFLERTFTNALIVIKDGRIVSETYRNKTDASTRFIAWSMTKSFVSAMVGAALAEGRIKSLDEQVTAYLPELKGGGYDGATIRNVLQMRSGVEYDERYDFQNPSAAQLNHENSLVQNRTRFADAARAIKRIHPPGEVFAYKTLDTAVLGWLVERAVGTTFANYLTQKLWEPLGTEAQGFFIMDGPPGVGREFTGAGFNATARDFARFGLMMLGEGSANGHQILSPQWVREATRPTTTPNASNYGYQWWTVPNSPAYYALGLQGQYVYVDPATKTVVVKMSYFPPANQKAGQETLAFMAAASAWTAR